MTRTIDQILLRMQDAVEHGDMFGTEASDLLQALPFEAAKPYLTAEATEAKWEAARPKNVRGEAIEYLDFAWGKANDQRGLSAGRSLAHYKAWLWLLGIDSVEWLDDYEFYGKPHLVTISVAFGIDWTKLDDGKWSNGKPDQAMLDAATKLGEELKAKLDA